ncbi:MAG: redoxin domain-containing protein [Planctomycetes bacterium]|nr:redoxin domain-containing protein [Planctomycetota bacterium]
MKFLSAVALTALAFGAARADQLPGTAPPPKLPKLDPANLKDPNEAAKVADQLEKDYPEATRPEAVKMLVTILRGQLMTGGGWFGPAETRYDWKWLAEKHKVDAKGAIGEKQFAGSAADFARLDRDGDGRIVPGDFDWSDRNPFVIQSGMVTRTFRRINTRGDGKLTQADMDAFFKRAAAGKDHVTLDDLRAALLASGPGGFIPGDAPTIEMLINGLYAGELGSIHEGPKLNAAAPDFTLKTLDGKGTVTLSKLVGPKPVVLVFGNFTCGPFRALAAEVDALAQRYKDRATFVMVYVREAHPTDGWIMESNTRVGVAVKQPTTFEERVKVCGLFADKVKPSYPVLVDEIDDRVGHGYSGMPGRLYVLDTAGKVAYKSGRGPFGFKAAEMEQALVMALLEAK